MSMRTTALVASVAITAGAQLYPPTVRDNPRTSAEVTAPPEVHRILRRSCYDCHSNETRWPWYSYVAPVSWLVTADVHEARRRLSFSRWPDSVPPDADCYFKRRIAERATNAEMPPLRYRMLHPSAEVSDNDTALLRSWAAAACEHD